MGRVFNAGSASAPTPTTGGRIQVFGTKNPTVESAAKPSLSTIDQKIFNSFQSLPQDARNSTLSRLQNSAKNGDKDAAHKLSYLVPAQSQNLPQAPDYTDHSLQGALYKVSQGVGSFIKSAVVDPVLRGGQALTTIQNNNINNRPSLQGVDLKQLAADTVNTGLNVVPIARGAEIAAKSAPLLTKALLGARAGAVYGATGSGATSFGKGDKPLEIAKNAAIGAGAGAALGAGAEVGGNIVGRLATAVKKTPDIREIPGALRFAQNAPVVNVTQPHGTIDVNKLKSFEGAPDRAKVNAYKADIKAGQPIEPLKILKDSKGKLGVEDGKHRLQAMKELGVKDIPVTGEGIDVSKTLQGLKANPTLTSELVAENKQILGNQRGAIGSEKVAPTPAIKELQDKVVSGLPEQPRVDLIKGRVSQAASQAKSQLLDRYSPIKSLSDAYESATGKTLPIENNPYALARLHAGTPEIAAQRVEDLGSLIREAPDMQALKDVGVAQRILTDRSGIKNPVSQETAQKVIDDYKQKLGPEAFAQTQQTVSKVVAYHDTMLKELADNGIISKDAYSSIKDKHKNYFAKFDVVDHLLDNSNNLAKGKSFNVAKQDLIKAQKGTESKIADPIEATIRQTIKGVDLINRNKVGQSLYKISKNSDLVNEIEAGASVPAGYEKISTFVDGNKIDLAVPKEVGESLKHLTAQQADLITRAMSKSGSLLRKGATSLNTGFALVSNPIRDVQSLALNSKYIRANPVSLGINWAKGFAEAVGQGDKYREFIANGGGQSTFFGRQPEKITDLAKGIERSQGQKLWKTITNPKELFGIIPAIEGTGQKFELAPRLAEYGAARKAGVSPAQAAYDARNVTVDFSQAGTVGQVMNQWVPFLNARLQGNVKSIEAIGRNPGRAALVAAYTVATPAIATYYWNTQHFNDIYQQIPQYVKDQNFIIIYGKGQDENGNPTDVVKIPKGSLGQVFGNTLEAFLEYTGGNSNKSIGQVAGEAVSNVSPIDFMQDGKISPTTALGGVLPPIVKAGVESGTNYSFFKGAPLVPQSLQSLPNNEQVFTHTSTLARVLAGITGQSPIKVDNTIQDISGSSASQLSDALSKATSANPTENPGDYAKSITGRIIGAKGGNVTNQFYNVLNDTSPLRASASKKITAAVAKGDVDGAQKIADSYNKTLDDKFADFKKKNDKYLTDDLKKTLEAQRIKLTKASISARKKSAKKASEK